MKEKYIQHIENLYPPDSPYEGTRLIGRELMDCTVGNTVGYNNWRNLPTEKLKILAKENLIEAQEHELAENL